MKETKANKEKKVKAIKQPKMLETILENMAQAVVIVDAEYKIVEFNNKFKELFSLKRDGIKKGIYYKEFIELWASQVKLNKKFVNEAKERMHVKEPFVFDTEYYYEKEKRWIQVYHNPLSDGGFVRTFTDITETKKADEILKDKSAEIDRFFSLTIDLLCISDMDGHFKRLNKAWEDVLGYKAEELLGKSFFELIHTEDIDDTGIAVSNLADGKVVSNFVNRYRCKDGSYRWLEWRATPYEHILIYAAARDITDRISFEEILRQNEEKYRFITENVGDMIWQIDKDYNYIYASPSVENILLYTPEELTGKSFFSFLTQNSADYLNEIERKYKNEYLFSPLKGGVYELQYIRKDGSLVWCEVHSSPLYTPDGKLIFSQGVTRDIKARKEAERKLKDYAAELKELNATKDRFFSIISHDLKSPFTGLIGMTQEFKENARDFSYDEIATYGNEMNNAVMNTYRLLENLLEWSRLQLDQVQFQPSQIELYDKVEKAFQLSGVNASQKEITLINSVEKSLKVYADINMINMILRNLIGNAIKFTEHGGCVEVESGLDNNDVLIIVKDNGIGITEEVRKKLFRTDTVYSTYGTEKEKGTGLGLLLCKEFLEKHNGRIWVESRLGKGSRFCFTLPNNSE
jgi:PAS domain S-box-containing protein